MMLNSYLPGKHVRYAIAGSAIGTIAPLALFAGDVFVAPGADQTSLAARAIPLGVTAVLTLFVFAGIVWGLNRRQARLAAQLASERKAAERLRHAAYHDSLTGLRNRHALGEDMAAVLRRQRRGTDSVALMLFDLDRFKFINDTLGHAAGDEVLKVLGQRISGRCDASQSVYRLGGDEFVVLWAGAPDVQRISDFCVGLTEAVFRPVAFNDHEIDTAGSIGVAIGSGEATLSDLLKRADLALYRAKETPGTGFCFFSDDMDSDYRLRRQLEADMRSGIAAGAFGVEYLPVVDAATLTPTGFCARLNWTHPDHGIITPENFMPMAEQSGLIVPLGKWLLQRALADAAGWRPQAEVTVPVSATQLADPGFAAAVLAALDDAGVEPTRLVCDIHADAANRENRTAISALAALRSAGVRIAVSEFAASVASLSMARPYPVDSVRIDLDHIRAIAGEARMAQMLSLFLQLAQTVGTPVILTGVDSAADMQSACAAGTADVQGQFAGPPLSSEQAGQFFDSMNGLARRQSPQSVLRIAS